MFKDLSKKIFGDPNEKEIQKIMPLVEKINILEESYQSLSDEEIKNKTNEFKERLASGAAKERARLEELQNLVDTGEAFADPKEKKKILKELEDAQKARFEKEQKLLNEMLPEAFAVVKNVCRRLCGKNVDVLGKEMEWNMVHYDVQIVGAIVLHQGRIGEMKTGEGKTLVATMPLYLNALLGRGAHLVTVNDYLARRDAALNGHVFSFLGLTTGVVVPGQSNADRKAAYECDITYGTNNEFGFDYLRDNMATALENMVQRELTYVIVDEVDSILIDESRTPLIISAPAEESTAKYGRYSHLINNLKENEHYNIDEKARTALLSEEGIAKMEELLGLTNIYTEAGFQEVHHIEAALKAKACYRKDIDYVVRDGEVVIVDEFTGRMLPGRRYSEGLHQAIEAKEGVEVRRQSKTLATITFQNLFRLYDKLAGMTGTAVTEAEEFGKIYNLDVVVIPTNKPIIRDDKTDNIYINDRAKYIAVVKRVKELHEKGQPVLIGTISIEKSELLSQLLKQEGVPHKVLNAKFHESEAEIVAEAGKKGAVTIATNMAGRGTDIKPDGEALGAGGLAILGTERHESRRIDNQLRGRSGRQGDPGETQFFISMDDDLVRVFGGDKMKAIMTTMKFPEDMPIQSKIISNSIETAQKRVEGHHFETREHVVKYDDVMNKHREIMYARRKRVLRCANLRAEVMEMIYEEVHGIVVNHTSNRDSEEWNIKEIFETVSAIHRSSELTLEKLEEHRGYRDDLIKMLTEYLMSAYEEREKNFPSAEMVRRVEKGVYLRSIDVLWMDHIDNMSKLRDSVSFRGYAQKDPLVEYKNEAFHAFIQLIGKITSNVVNTLFKIQIQENTQIRQQQPQVIRTNEKEIEGQLSESHIESDAPKVQRVAPTQTQQSNDGVRVIRVNQGAQSTEQASSTEKVGRNDPCPCGSGKKYKKCHGIGA